jgi:hypothetical protein
MSNSALNTLREITVDKMLLTKSSISLIHTIYEVNFSLLSLGNNMGFGNP